MKHTCFQTTLAGFNIELAQTGINKFTVAYGKMETKRLNYANAAAELGASIMHALACEGKLDNRNETEAREAGDREPVFES